MDKESTIKKLWSVISPPLNDTMLRQLGEEPPNATIPAQKETSAESVDDAATDERLGSTPEERTARVAIAWKWATAANIASAGVVVWAFLSPQPYEVVIVVLFAMPCVALWWAARSNGLYRLGGSRPGGRWSWLGFGQREGVRPNLGMLLSGSAVVLGIRAIQDIHVLEWAGVREVVVAAVVAGAVLGYLAHRIDPSLRPPSLWFMFALLGFYVYGVVVEANALLDQKPAQKFTVAVTGKHASSGRHVTQYLLLAPWGPVRDSDDVSVSRALYDSISPPATVCVDLHSGLLGIPWYAVMKCS